MKSTVSGAYIDTENVGLYPPHPPPPKKTREFDDNYQEL